jgi:hypothetical protein
MRRSRIAAGVHHYSRFKIEDLFRYCIAQGLEQETFQRQESIVNNNSPNSTCTRRVN